MFATLALSLLALAQQRTTVTETWPNGRAKVEREVVVDEHDAEVNDGSYRSWYENGQLEHEGRFSRASRSGDWESWHENGQRASRGRYVKDRRDGKWTFWSATGIEDDASTGEWEFSSWSDESGASAEGYTVDGERQDAWTFRWPDGTVLSEGRYREGLRDGEWLLRHSDGSVAWMLGSGTYAGSPRVPLTYARWRELASQPKSAPTRKAKSVRSKPTVPPPTDLLDFDVAALSVAELAALDVSTPDGAQRGALLDEALRVFANGHGFGWRDGTSEGDAEYRSEVARSWTTLWRLAEHDTRFWYRHLAVAPGEPNEPSPVLCDFDPAITRDPSATETAESDWMAERAAVKRHLKPRAGRETEKALQNALDWLVRHQSPEGNWSCARFDANCGKLGVDKCNGAGKDLTDEVGRVVPSCDVGVTGLALLVLVGDGNTLGEGPHRDSVASAVAWLLAAQEPEHGLLGIRMPAAHYNHAVATQALCEVSASSRSAVVARAAQRAVDYILWARNENAAWRYAVADGSNDTSITGWMVMALESATLSGLEVDPKATSGAVAFVDAVTDESGRTGYTEAGQGSARLPEAYESFPAELTEALTAAGILVRIFGGRTEASDPRIDLGANRLMQRLPTWDAESGAIDFYYWYYGSLALFQIGGARWDKWNQALKAAVIKNQCQNEKQDEYGSWDPIDPWGSQAGRVYMTAMGALCLEAPYRYPKLDLEPSKKR